ncbi:hypothetical protein ACRALDRAFT_207415 [Sodiomyces alcalophilus JCM 7366]|uniref:uncharacterized protein n=1 Tax=Sodiomyces alcalophilus JCM 7366 TaxID=591952 RepID=UPI0039B445AF
MGPQSDVVEVVYFAVACYMYTVLSVLMVGCGRLQKSGSGPRTYCSWGNSPPPITSLSSSSSFTYFHLFITSPLPTTVPSTLYHPVSLFVSFCPSSSTVLQLAII